LLKGAQKIEFPQGVGISMLRLRITHQKTRSLIGMNIGMNTTIFSENKSEMQEGA